MFEKPIDTSAPVHELIARRWSGRAYDSSRSLGDEQLLSVLEAARWAPSCFGEQPWRYLICDRARDPGAWDKAFSCLTPGNQSWAADAPILIATCCDTVFSHNGQPNAHAEYDAGAASLSLCLQATALGLMAHQMAGFSRDRMRELFAIPARVTPVAMMTLGYQLAPERIPERLREKELAPRARGPLEERFFLGEWGRGIKGPE